MGLGHFLYFHRIDVVALNQLALPGLRRVPVCHRLYRLRWAFDFVDRPTRRGVWDGATDLDSDGAWCISKTGLRYARIETETLTGAAKGEVTSVLEIDGEDYTCAKWVVHVRAAALGGPVSMNLSPRVHGLRMQTRDEAITIFVDGTASRRPLTADERKFALTEHRLGAGLGEFR